MVQIGIENPRVFMIGGGEYKSLPDSMFQCKELVPANGGSYNFQFVERKSMKFARHGHSCCVFMDRFVVVTGSRKEINDAGNRVEIYDINQNEWMELAKLNEARHYHSSCSFNDKFIFVFGGIENSNKKYSATIERLSLSFENPTNPWQKINYREGPGFAQIVARQGAGMCQMSNDDIMIVGGFNGKFLGDYYQITVDGNDGNISGVQHKQNNPDQTVNLFPF